MDIKRIQRFANDEATNKAVFEFLMDHFTKPAKDTDIHYLAAARLSIDQLKAAWKEIENKKNLPEIEEKVVKQVGM